MKKIIGFYYWLFIIWLSIKWMFRITLGDEVIYKNKKYQILNGVAYNSWELMDFNSNNCIGYVPRKDCIKIWSLYGLIRSFKSGYNFYMTSWYSIWCNEGILPWMRNCSIW